MYDIGLIKKFLGKTIKNSMNGIMKLNLNSHKICTYLCA